MPVDRGVEDETERDIEEPERSSGGELAGGPVEAIGNSIEIDQSKLRPLKLNAMQPAAIAPTAKPA